MSIFHHDTTSDSTSRGRNEESYPGVEGNIHEGEKEGHQPSSLFPVLEYGTLLQHVSRIEGKEEDVIVEARMLARRSLCLAIGGQTFVGVH